MSIPDFGTPPGHLTSSAPCWGMVDIARPGGYVTAMPKHSASDMLKRWVALDKALTDTQIGGGLNLTKFAKQWNVDAKTIRRDLKLFRELGYPANLHMYDEMGRDIFRWSYRHGQRSMFTVNTRKPI